MSENQEVSIAGRKIMVCIPTYNGDVDIRIAGALLDAKDIFNQHGAQMGLAFMRYCSSIATARNTLADMFMRNEAWTDMVMIDADTVFRPEDLVRLVGHATLYPFMAGLVPILLQDDASRRKVYRSTIPEDKVEQNEHGLIKTERIGGAFICVRREAMDAMELVADDCRNRQTGATMSRFFAEEFRDGSVIGEDYYFCDLAGRAGVEVHIDPYGQFNHVKKIDVDGCFAMEMADIKFE
jgi:hypothetical protein